MSWLFFFIMFLAVFYLVAALSAAASSGAACDCRPPSKPELRPFDLMTPEEKRAHLRPLTEKKYREAVKAAAREKRSVSELDETIYADFMSEKPLSNPAVGEALLRRLRAPGPTL